MTRQRHTASFIQLLLVALISARATMAFSHAKVQTASTSAPRWIVPAENLSPRPGEAVPPT